MFSLRSHLILDRYRQRLCIFIFVCFIAIAADFTQAQILETLEGEFLTLATIGLNTTSKDTASAITSDSKGNLYIVGTSDAFTRGGGSDLGQADAADLLGKDVYIAKFSATAKNIEWIVRTGSSDEDEGRDIAVNAEGTSLYVLGRTNGQYGSIPRNGQYDIFLIKYDIGNPGAPRQSWDGPKLIGTSAAEAATEMKIDHAGDFVYVIGHTRGQLFPSSSGSQGTDLDAFIFRCQVSDGAVELSRQFGTADDDTAKSLVLPELGGEFLTVGVDTVRQVGNLDIKNVQVFTLRVDDLSVATSFLVKSFSPEAVVGVSRHPLFPESLFLGGSTWLSSITGWDFSVKKLDKTSTDSGNEARIVDATSLGMNEYSFRRGSIDNADETSVGMQLNPVSGRLWIAGITSGKMTASVLSSGASQIVLAAVEPETGEMVGVAQDQDEKSPFTSIAGFSFSPDSSGIIYVATRLEQGSGNLYTIIGTYGIPVALRDAITPPAPRPSPNSSTAPSEQRELQETAAEPGSNMAIIIGGAAGGSVVAVIIVISLCALCRTKKESKNLKLGQGQEQRGKKKSGSKEKVRRPSPAARPHRPLTPPAAGNISGLV